MHFLLTAVQEVTEPSTLQKFFILSEFFLRVLLMFFEMLVIFSIPFLFIAYVILRKIKSKSVRSHYKYVFRDKLFPSDSQFVQNDSWTHYELNKFWYHYYLERSQYKYKGEDHLTPNQPNFIPNESWTSARIQKFNQQIEAQSYTRKENSQ